MSKELKLLNLACVIIALGFLFIAVYTLLTAGDLLTTDALFFSTVCLLMAVIFGVHPLFNLHSQGKLPIPFLGKPKPSEHQLASSSPAPAKSVWGSTTAKVPTLLDAKGRAVPPDVRAMMSQMRKTETKDA